MDELKIYEISNEYIDFLGQYETKMFHNKTAVQANERKYLGVVLSVNGMDYFVPLSSYKPKHDKLKESTDLIKIRKYAVLNLNNMFPAPAQVCRYVDFSAVQDEKYRSLLLAEYRYIKAVSERIIKNASVVYQHKIRYGNSTALSRRTNNFVELERAFREYKMSKGSEEA